MATSHSHSRARASRRRRGSSSSSISPVWALVSLLCVVGLAVTLVLMANSDRVSKPQNINGDVVGPEFSEPIGDYVHRADASLADRAHEEASGENGGAAGGASSNSGGGESSPKYWALVSFAKPEHTAEAAASVEGLPDVRVASILVGAISSRDLPEPVDGASRQSVFDQEMAMVYQKSGLSPDDPEVGIHGVLVYADLANLKEIRGRHDVVAVEALPSDAARGRFGIRPMQYTTNN